MVTLSALYNDTSIDLLQPAVMAAMRVSTIKGLLIGREEAML